MVEPLRREGGVKQPEPIKKNRKKLISIRRKKSQHHETQKLSIVNIDQPKKVINNFGHCTWTSQKMNLTKKKVIHFYPF